MVSATRRALLSGAAATVAGLTGCSGANRSSSSSPPDDPANVATEPDAVGIRGSENTPLAWLGERPTPTGERRISDHVTELVASAEAAEDLDYAEVDGVEAMQAFVSDTDFDRETLLLESHRVPECYRLELCAVTWSAASYHTYWSRRYRPADVACAADAHDRVAHLVRIPGVIDPSQLSSAGARTSSGSCDKFRQLLTGRGPQ